jgi:hypothetical protein
VPSLRYTTARRTEGCGPVATNAKTKTMSEGESEQRSLFTVWCSRPQRSPKQFSSRKGKTYDLGGVKALPQEAWRLPENSAGYHGRLEAKLEFDCTELLLRFADDALDPFLGVAQKRDVSGHRTYNYLLVELS